MVITKYLAKIRDRLDRRTNPKWPESAWVKAQLYYGLDDIHQFQQMWANCQWPHGLRYRRLPGYIAVFQLSALPMEPYRDRVTNAVRRALRWSRFRLTAEKQANSSEEVSRVLATALLQQITITNLNERYPMENKKATNQGEAQAGAHRTIRLEDVTEEQWAEVEALCSQWLKDTTKQYTDDEIVEVVNRMYRSMDLDEPLVLIADSPLQMVLWSGIVSKLAAKAKEDPAAFERELHELMINSGGFESRGMLCNKLWKSFLNANEQVSDQQSPEPAVPEDFVGPEAWSCLRLQRVVSELLEASFKEALQSIQLPEGGSASKLKSQVSEVYATQHTQLEQHSEDCFVALSLELSASLHDRLTEAYASAFSSLHGLDQQLTTALRRLQQDRSLSPYIESGSSDPKPFLTTNLRDISRDMDRQKDGQLPDLSEPKLDEPHWWAMEAVDELVGIELYSVLEGLTAEVNEDSGEPAKYLQQGLLAAALVSAVFAWVQRGDQAVLAEVREGLKESFDRGVGQPLQSKVHEILDAIDDNSLCDFYEQGCSTKAFNEAGCGLGDDGSAQPEQASQAVREQLIQQLNRAALNVDEIMSHPDLTEKLQEACKRRIDPALRKRLDDDRGHLISSLSTEELAAEVKTKLTMKICEVQPQYFLLRDFQERIMAQAFARLSAAAGDEQPTTQLPELFSLDRLVEALDLGNKWVGGPFTPDKSGNPELQAELESELESQIKDRDTYQVMEELERKYNGENLVAVTAGRLSDLINEDLVEEVERQVQMFSPEELIRLAREVVLATSRRWLGEGAKTEEERARCAATRQFVAGLVERVKERIREKLGEDQVYANLWPRLQKIQRELEQGIAEAERVGFGVSVLGMSRHARLAEALSRMIDSCLSPETVEEQEELKAHFQSQPWYVGIWWRTWSGYYAGAELLGVKFDQDKYELFRDWNNRAPVWCAYNGLCVVSRNPTEIHWQDQELHNESGPAVRYVDGWGAWAINGVQVDEQVVMRPETQTIQQIRAEENQEVKRVRIERFGWKRYIEEVGATLLDRRRNDVDGTNEALFELPDDMRAFVGRCRSTGRVYFMEVGDDVATCAQAQQWLVGREGANCIGAS